MAEQLRVLVVDDDEVVRTAIVRALRHGGMAIDAEACATAEEGLHRLREGFACALVDYQLPGMNGIGLIKAARAAGISTPIVILTGCGDECLAVEAMRAGAADYLSKSRMTPETLCQSLRHAMRFQEALQRAEQASEDLRKSQELLRRTVETMNDGLLTLDLQGRYILVNPAVERLLGMSAAAVTSHRYDLPPWQRLRLDGSPLPPEEHPFAVAMRTGQPVSRFEFAVIRPDGKRLVVAVSIAPLRGPDGRIEGAVETVRDITDRVQAEESLRQSERFVQHVIRTTPDLIYVYDLLEERNVYANGQITAILGYQPADVLAMGAGGIGRMIHPDDLPGALQHHQGFATARDGEVREVEYRMRHANGQWRWLHSRETVFGRLPDGRPFRVIGAALDITHRKQMEEALRQSNQELAALINASPLAVCAMDRNWRLVAWNPAAERMFGWKAPEVLGGPIPFIPEESQDEFRSLAARILKGQGLRGVELRRKRQDGSSIDISLWAAPLPDSAGRVGGALALIEDITQAKRLQEQLLQAHRMETVGRLAGGVAHDFNNLLAVISGYSESLARRIEPEDPLRAAVEEIQRAADRGADLTRQLLAFSRQQAIEPVVLDLRSAIANVCQMLRRVISDRIEIVVRHEMGAALVKADPGQMEQVLVNLAVNARDAMPQGGRLVIATSEMAVRGRRGKLRAGTYVKLEVSDTGCGMDPQIRSRIFEPFFTTKAGAGTGLGLSIVYGIVQQCRGDIQVVSEPSKGSTFTVLLPRAKTGDRSAEAGKTQEGTA